MNSYNNGANSEAFGNGGNDNSCKTCEINCPSNKHVPSCANPCHRPCQEQGDQTEIQGNQTEIQGDQTEIQGDQTETLGDQTQSQGDLGQNQGDLNQSQGGETQGDQVQGDQTQTMTGHGGQYQGEQCLINTPTISAPVSVNGVNLNLTLHCGECGNTKICEACNDIISRFLNLLKLLQYSSPNLTQAEVDVLGFCNGSTQITGELLEVIENCLVIIAPNSGENNLVISLEAIEMILLEDTGEEPNLLTRLFAYLQSADCSFIDQCGCARNNCGCGDCGEAITAQLALMMSSGAIIQINTANNQAQGYIYKICNGIVYLVDDLGNPTVMYAIPICRITCFQTLATDETINVR